MGVAYIRTTISAYVGVDDRNKINKINLGPLGGFTALH